MIWLMAWDSEAARTKMQLILAHMFKRQLVRRPAENAC